VVLGRERVSRRQPKNSARPGREKRQPRAGRRPRHERNPMSALPPKANMAQRVGAVRFVPKADICSAAIYDLLEQVLTYFCQQVARAVRLRHVVITSRCSRYMFFPIQRM